MCNGLTSIFYSIVFSSYLSITLYLSLCPVLPQQSGVPVLPAVNEHQRLAKKKHHSCDQCGKHFTCISKLKKHQRIHTGEKPYGCVQCGKQFTQMSNLKTHQRVHTGEKPYGCVDCGKQFARMSNLKSHQISHSGEKTHHCEQCGKAFGHPESLKRHKLLHCWFPCCHVYLNLFARTVVYCL